MIPCSLLTRTRRIPRPRSRSSPLPSCSMRPTSSSPSLADQPQMSKQAMAATCLATLHATGKLPTSSVPALTSLTAALKAALKTRGLTLNFDNGKGGSAPKSGAQSADRYAAGDAHAPRDRYGRPTHRRDILGTPSSRSYRDSRQAEASGEPKITSGRPQVALSRAWPCACTFSAVRVLDGTLKAVGSPGAPHVWRPRAWFPHVRVCASLSVRERAPATVAR